MTADGEIRIAGRERVLLALLLLHANRPVDTVRLVDAIWGEEPPRDARNQLQGCVSRLRKRLNGAGTSRRTIVTDAAGYRLDVDDSAVDLRRFHKRLSEARTAAGAGSLRAARDSYRAAMALWRGPALAGIDSSLVRKAATALDEEHLRALEERIEIELTLGATGELVPELTDLVARHPYRETLHGALMVALYRSGRQADALAAYQRVRNTLVEEVGTEPGAKLRELHQAILRDNLAPAMLRDAVAGGQATPDQPTVTASESDLAAPSPSKTHLVTPPRQLPADVATFTGRAAELTSIVEALASDRNGPVVISAIDGTGGIGKSALAIHAAHRLADGFPDGQLYVDLQGATSHPPPLEPLEVIGRFLRTLGVASDAIPAELAEAAALFRSTAAGRMMLIVLDNARDTTQITPLLPGTAGCAVLVTSRRTLTSLPTARHLHLDVLPEPEAVALLAQLAGAARVGPEPDAAAQVCRWCGHLPLALRIAGARLAARPGWHVQALADRLANAGRRLDELELAEIGVRASFTVSHAELANSGDPLDRAAADAFPLLGLPDGPDFGLNAAARLLDRPEPTAERILERLVDASLLQSPAPGRYRLHDLIRLTAVEHATSHYPPTQRAAALTRLFTRYTAITWGTHALLHPTESRLARIDQRYASEAVTFAETDTAMDWLETERSNLVAAVRQATCTPGVDSRIGIQLAHALFGFFYIRSYWEDLVQVNQFATAAAREASDQLTQAVASSDIAVVCWRRGRYSEAVARLTESLTLYRELSDRLGQAQCLNNLSAIYIKQGAYAMAREYSQRSLTIHKALSNRRGQAISLTRLGLCFHEEGRFEEELACCQESLTINRELGDKHGESVALENLGTAHQMLGRHREAVACLQESLMINRELGDLYGQAECLTDLSLVYRNEGNPLEALAFLRASLAIREELGDHHGQAVTHREMGQILLSLDRVDQTEAHWRDAHALLERLQSPDTDEIRRMLTELAPRLPRMLGVTDDTDG